MIPLICDRIIIPSVINFMPQEIEFFKYLLFTSLDTPLHPGVQVNATVDKKQ